MISVINKFLTLKAAVWRKTRDYRFAPRDAPVTGLNWGPCIW